MQTILNNRLTGAAFGILALAAVVRPADAQTPFRIARPADGASVRETVRIQIPRSALRGMSYLQLSIDDRFRFGLAVPPAGKAVRSKMVEANNQVVTVLWDTKGSMTKAATIGESDADKEKRETLSTAVEDGTHTLEITSHDAAGKRIGRQTLTLNVANRGNLQMPGNGILMDYHFQVGEEARYDQITSVKYIGERQEAPQGANFNRPGGFGGGSPFGGGGSPFGGGGSPFGGGGNPFGGGGPPNFGGGNPFGGGGAGRNFGGSRGGRRGGAGGGEDGGGGSFGGAGRFGGGGNPFGGGGGFGGGGAGAPPTGPFSLPVQDVRATYESTPEDVAGGGAYFIRDKVVDGSILSGNNAALLSSVYDFKSRYRVLTSSGFIVDQGGGNASKPGAYVALPLPNLGGGYRRINQTWNSLTPVILEWATMDKPAMVNATNRLVGLEWQDGYQTARIEQTYNGAANLPIFGGAAKMNGANVKMDRTIWFAYRAGKIIRMETVVEADGQGPSTIIAAMAPGAGIGGAPGGFGGGAPGGSFGGGRFGGGGNPFGGGGGSPFGGGGPPSFGSSGSPFGQGGASGISLAGAGNAASGFGVLQQQQEVPLAPAKFRSVTTVTLAKLKTASQMAANDFYVREVSSSSRSVRRHVKCLPSRAKFVHKKRG